MPSKSRKKPETPAAVQTARAPEPPPVWRRVRTVRRHLEERTWGTDQAEQLAQAWGISLDLVQRHAAEAQRQLEAVLDDRRGEVTIAADLEAGLDLAFEQGDPYAVRGLIAEKLKLHGIGAHRDPKNDPKPAEQAQEGGKVLPWRKKA